MDGTLRCLTVPYLRTLMNLFAHCSANNDATSVPRRCQTISNAAKSGYMRELGWVSFLSFNVMIAKYPIGATNPHNENTHARFLSRTHISHPIIAIITPTTVPTSPLVRPVSKATLPATIRIAPAHSRKYLSVRFFFIN